MPPQSFSPAREQQRVIVGRQVGRRLHAHVGGRARAARRRSCAPGRRRRLGRVGQRDGRLGAEVLDDDFLHVTVARGAGRGWRSACRRAPPSVSPMPIRSPVVNGMRSSPASRSIARRTRRLLVGRPLVHLAAPAQPRRHVLEHEAEADVHAAAGAPSRRASGCRRWCAAGARSRARSRRHARRTRRSCDGRARRASSR